MNDVPQTPSARLGPGGHWRNWVGNQSFIARHIAEPASENELAPLVHEAGRQNLPIRVAGFGHSFTPVVATSGMLLSLKTMQGLVRADPDRERVVVRAGTRIGDIGRALKQIGLSLANQGDIDTQAIAGTVSTGTHGIGIGLGCLSSQAVGMRLVQPDRSAQNYAAPCAREVIFQPMKPRRSFFFLSCARRPESGKCRRASGSRQRPNSPSCSTNGSFKPDGTTRAHTGAGRR